MLQEFEPYVESWTLIPDEGGRFEIEVNGKLVYSKLQTRRHAEIDEIRDLLRHALNEMPTS
jgi:selenoprotein W-related protein